MIYKVNEEGVAALRTMAGEITNAIECIVGETKNAKTFVDGYRNTLGPHAETINSALDGIASCIKASTDSALEVSFKLHEIANDYQEEIDDDPYVRTIGARRR